MREFNIGDIVYFDRNSVRGRGEILEKNVGANKSCQLLEMLDECNWGYGHNGGGYCMGHYSEKNYWYVPMDDASLKLLQSAEEVVIRQNLWMDLLNVIMNCLFVKFGWLMQKMEKIKLKKPN